MKRLNRMFMKAAAAAGALALLGAALLAQTAGGFRFDGPLSRVVTPNGDGANDVAVICFDNPSDSDVSGRVYTLLGSEVAQFQAPKSAAGTGCPAGNPSLPREQHLDWDPRAQGSVRGGVYVYQIKAEGQTYSGTLLVVR